MALTMLDKSAEKKDKRRGRPISPPNSSAKRRSPIRASARPCCRRTSARACGSSASRPASASASTATCSIISGPRCPAGAAASTCIDGTTVEYTYQPGETRHESYGPGEFKVHDLENLGDKEMVFMTVEFKDSANKPMPLPAGVHEASRSLNASHREKPTCPACTGQWDCSLCRGWYRSACAINRLAKPAAFLQTK